MKKKFSRKQLLKWLKTTAGITLLSISIGNDVSKVISNTSSPQFIEAAMQQRLEAFPKGNYIVEYDYTTEESDQTQDEFPYPELVWAIAYDANVTGGGKILNLSSLLNEITDFEYVKTSTKDADEAYNLTTIFVKKPENPLELEELILILNKYASFVSIEDGSGKVTSSNSFINGKKYI